MSDPAASNEFLSRSRMLESRLQTLPDKPEETAISALRVLWHLASGRAYSVEAASDTPLPTLDAAGLDRVDDLMAQRLSGTPLAHLSGRQRFMGLEMLAGKTALIPRRETEVLARSALELLDEMTGKLTVVDVCTGSGNLALAIAHHQPRAKVFAADLSDEAVTLARENAIHLSLSLRVEFRTGDLLEPFNQSEFRDRVDLLVCNPPYISSQKVNSMAGEIREFEPRIAFDGGPLGIRILQRLIREAPDYLRPGGWLAFEVGLGQGQAVLKRLQASGSFRRCMSVKGPEGEVRVLLASR